MLHVESIDHAFGVDTVETWLDLLPAPGRRRARWLPLRAHFFVRPHYGQLVLIDLDDYADTLDRLLRLQPRAIVETSPGSVQLWLTIDMRHAPKDALTVTRELTHSLHGDPACIRTTQVGRMPGSINRKPGKGNMVRLLFSAVQDLSEAAYLQETSVKSVPRRPSKVVDWKWPIEIVGLPIKDCDFPGLC